MLIFFLIMKVDVIKKIKLINVTNNIKSTMKMQILKKKIQNISDIHNLFDCKFNYIFHSFIKTFYFYIYMELLLICLYVFNQVTKNINDYCLTLHVRVLW